MSMEKLREQIFGSRVASSDCLSGSCSDLDETSATVISLDTPLISATSLAGIDEIAEFEDPYVSLIHLKREDIDNVRKKWRKIKNDPVTFGTLVFQTLLNDSPATAKKWKVRPAELHRGLLVYDENTIQIATEVAKLFNLIVRQLDQPQIATNTAYKFGIKISHPRESYSRRDFQNLYAALVKTLTTYYKMNNTPEIIDSISKTLLILLLIIEDATHWDGFGKIC